MKRQSHGTEKITGIYSITSPTGRIYIGQSIDIERRWKEHKYRSTNNTTKLYESFKKYGVEKHIFEIIEVCRKEDLNQRERYWQETLNAVSQGLNYILTETDTKPRVNYLTEEHKANISKGKTGQSISPETRKKISEANKGRVAWNKGKQGVQKHSEETKEKLRIMKTGKPNLGTLGRKRSEAEKKAISEKMKEIWAKRLQSKK